MKNNEEVFASNDVVTSFNEFVNACSDYFRMLDNNDINQLEYKELDETSCQENEQLFNPLTKLEYRNIEIKKKDPFHGFIGRKKLYKDTNIILPEQKSIDLENPKLKTKGLRKKKNVSIMYADITVGSEERKSKIEKEKEVVAIVKTDIVCE
jgi:hypothetical protein